MGEVVVDITTSLDGFIAGPNDGPELPLGEGGERLHQWVYELASWREPHGLAGGKTTRDSEVLDEAFKAAGAIVIGRRMFDNAREWGDNPPFHMPVFVLTHEVREKVAKEGGTTFTFVNNGIESALEQARAAAGDKNRRRRECHSAVPPGWTSRRNADSYRAHAPRLRYPIVRASRR